MGRKVLRTDRRGVRSAKVRAEQVASSARREIRIKPRKLSQGKGIIDTRKGPQPKLEAFLLLREARMPGRQILVHAVHAAAVAAAGRSSLGLRNLDNQCFGGEQETGNRGRVLQRRAGDLGGVDDAGLDQVLEDVG